MSLVSFCKIFKNQLCVTSFPCVEFTNATQIDYCYTIRIYVEFQVKPGTNFIDLVKITALFDHRKS